MGLEEKLTQAGYRMLGAQGVEQLINEVLAKGTIRHLKAIPVLIALHPVSTQQLLLTTTHKNLLEQVLTITERLFEEFNIPKSLGTFTKRIGELSYEEFKQEFELQRHQPEFIVDKQKVLLERETHYWLAQLFSKKEQEIIKAVLDDKPVTKTEYEYFSRKTKKKLKAITKLRDLALALQEQQPTRTS